MSSIKSLCSTVCCIVVIIFQYERSTTVSAWSTIQQGPVLYYYSQRRSVLRESATRRWYNNLDDTSAAAASSCSADAAEVDLSDTLQKQERMLASINEKRNAYHNRITKQSSMSSILFDDYTAAATTITTNENNDKTSTKQQQQQLLDIRILLIDNHDSYTYNLYQYLCTMTTHPVHVIMNDAFMSYTEFMASLYNSSNSTAESIIEAEAATTTTKPTTLEKYYDCIILSPGPGQPSQPLDMGIVLDVIRSNSQLPILGVCLGHQALGYVYGAQVVLAPRGPVHGLLSCIYYTDDTSKNNDGIGDSNEDEPGEMMMTQCNNNCQLFHGLPQNFNVVRYHSLVVDFSSTTSSSHMVVDEYHRETNELEIEPIAWCSAHVADSNSNNNNLNHNNNADSDTQNDDSSSICMALQHKKYPHYGVQFHPESIGTGVAGYQLLRNFCDFVNTYTNKNGNISHISNNNVDPVGVEDMSPSTAKTNDENNDIGNSNSIQSKYRVFIHKLDNNNNNSNSRKEGHSSLSLPIQVFEEIYSHNSNSFFLDSSTGENANFNNDGNDVDQDDDNIGCPIKNNSRFSIMGSNDGPLSRKIEYYGSEHEFSRQGLRVIHSNNHRSDAVEIDVNEVDTDILSYLRQRLVDHGEFVDYAEIITFDNSFVLDAATTTNSSTDLGYKLQRMDEFNQGGSDEDGIPFEYRGGYVGYLGYEVRHDTQCRIFEREGGTGCNVVNGKDDTSTSTTSSKTLITNPNTPTASFLFVDRSLLYDHQTGDWYMIGIIENDSPEHDDRVGEIVSWMKSMESRIKSLDQNQDIVESVQFNAGSNIIEEVTFVPRKSILRYQNDIARSYHEIRNGESYELCLTNQFEAEIRLPKKHASPFELYKLLRKRNPAPFSSFINLYNDHGESSSSSSQKNTASVSICCSSPERFLSVTRSQSTASLHTSYGAGNSDQYRRPRRQFVVESKPIKGTKARYSGTTTDGAVESDEYIKLFDSQIAIELSQSVKDRAENLMIVDLLRNDLGRVCQVGSIHVPKLMQIESYATVHQMVSTVRGTLDGDMMNVIDVIEACFPGGSMTGAPKQRSMEILNDIEEGVSRGPYSGCLGYISLNGSMDMNIVIRSAILTPIDKTTSTNDDLEEWKVSVGCGGAITALSDSDDEYDEMLLKSRIVRSAISDWVAQATEKLGRHISQAEDTSLPRHKKII